MLTNNEREEVIKMIPPAGVTVTTICGITLADWVYIATFIYIIIQTVILLLRTFSKRDNHKG